MILPDNRSFSSSVLPIALSKTSAPEVLLLSDLVVMKTNIINPADNIINIGNGLIPTLCLQNELGDGKENRSKG
jgi:hypothetical protein